VAKEEGVLVSINSDAHSTFDFDNLRFGIGQARRGWLEKKNVLNTRSLSELQVLINRTMQRPVRRRRRDEQNDHDSSAPRPR
jgi:DNA polymerase (family 10)